MKRFGGEESLAVQTDGANLGFSLVTYGWINLYPWVSPMHTNPCFMHTQRSLTGMIDLPVDVELSRIAPTSFLVPFVLENIFD